MARMTDETARVAAVRSDRRARRAARCLRRPREVTIGPIDGNAAWAADDIAVVAHRDELERAFLTLSVDHRAVLVLTHYVGLPAADVAATLGIPVGTVHSRLHRSIQAMRRSLAAGSRDAQVVGELGR